MRIDPIEQQLICGLPTALYTPGSTLNYPEHGNYLLVFTEEGIPEPFVENFDEFEAAFREFTTISDLLAKRTLHGIVSIGIIKEESQELIDFFVSLKK